ncbi:MAG: response regulator [Acidobacteriia bacterium]|nr:response regulator [Terriglobia bacterium]
MRSYRDFSIRHKLQGMVLVSCGVALFVASAAFTIYDRTTFLRVKTRDLITSAKMIGSNSTAALTFRDARSAQETLSALQARPHVIHACIYDANGKVFAKYSRAASEPGSCPATAQGEPSAVAAQRIVVSQNIGLSGESIGSIYIEADLTDMEERLRRFMLIDALVLLGSLAVAFMLSHRLQRVISEPIQELAKTASAVSAEKNYSIRAIKRSQDEIGGLFDQFNSMLDRIQSRDVALQKAHDELEIRVEERTSYLNALIETSPLAIMVLDPAEKVQLCNPAFERLFHWTRQELIGKPAHELLADGDSFLQARTIPQGTLGGTLVNLATRRRRKDGSLIDVEVHAVPLVVKGQRVGSLSIYQDISVRKRAEEAMQHAKEAAEASSRAKSEFLANMSHEIRTPMNGIMGMTELVLDTELDSEQREYLNMAKSSADSLLSLIDDILDYSKIEAGKLEIETIDFKLGDTIGDTMKTLSLRAHQKRLELAYDVAPDVADYLRGDPGRLRQIIVNLVGNAIKFTERGDVVLRVQADRRANDDVQLHFTISDTGIGISPERQSAIFQAFTQADGSMSRTYGGTGLGLTIASRLVGLMHGRIWVESELHKGSDFHFTARFGLQKAPAKTILRKDPGILRDMPVLVVDDNAASRHILLKMLTDWNTKPLAVESGTKAISALQETQGSGRNFPLILVDAQMPEMDGFALTESIKKNPEWRASIIMMLSSVGQPGDAKRCRELGIAAYLTKPFQQADLLDAVLTTLGTRPQKDASPALVTRHSLRENSIPLRVLLAEDNAINQTLAVRLLEKRGHRVTMVGNGKEALAALEKDSFDLVLMDVQMPEMDGFAATAAIREKEKSSGNHLPVVAMTAHAMVGDRERCLEAGMDDYITKPICLHDLTELLGHYSPLESAKAHCQES